MVAAARSAGQYDGILAGNPGYNLPRAAVAQLYGAQQYAKVASARTADGLPDLQTAFTPVELKLVADRVLARCDALDGLADGIVSNVKACQARFELESDVPTCAGARNGSCLNAAQKTALADVFAGARNSSGPADLQQLPLRCRHQRRQLARVEVREPADARCRRGGLHLQHAAAGRTRRRPAPSRWASTWTATRR